MKKAQGLSLNVIIIAAIVLIILVVLSSIFFGRTEQFVEEIQTCRGRCTPKGSCAAVSPDGECPNSDSSTDTDGITIDTLFAQDQECCVLKDV